MVLYTEYGNRANIYFHTPTVQWRINIKSMKFNEVMLFYLIIEPMYHCKKLIYVSIDCLKNQLIKYK